MFYVYVLRNTRGLQYIGHTNNLERRLKQHTSSDGQLHLGKYTHRMVYERQQRRPNCEFELSGSRVILTLVEQAGAVAFTDGRGGIGDFHFPVDLFDVKGHGFAKERF